MKKIIPLALVSGFCLFSYTTVASQTQKNREPIAIPQLEQEQLNYNKKIKPTLKTGDHLFLKLGFEKAYTVRQYLRGLWDSIWADEKINSVGFIYKNDVDTYVLFSQFGQQRVMSFDDFTFLMYVQLVLHQQNWRKDFDFHTKLSQIVQKTKGEVKAQSIRQKATDFVNRINFTMLGVKNYETCFKLQHLFTTKSQKPKPIETLSTRVIKRLFELQQKYLKQLEQKAKNERVQK